MDLPKQLLCLSSGARPRYKEDLLRSTAIPTGTELRFRYSDDIVTPVLQSLLESGQLKWTPILIAYLDRSTLPPTIIPIRHAKLIAAKRVGHFFILDFEVNSFALAVNVDDFNAEARRIVPDLPDWKGSELTGNFCCATQSVLPGTESSDQASTWEAVVEQLDERPDFADVRYYYFIHGIFESISGNHVAAHRGAFPLLSDRSYEARILHYSPAEDDADVLGDVNFLWATSDADHVTFVNSPNLAIDSPYDEKRLRFRTGSCVTDVDSLVSFYRSASGAASASGKSTMNCDARQKPGRVFPSAENSILEFDMHLRIRRRRWTLLWQGVVVGAAIGVQGITPIWANPNIAEKWFPSLVALGAGIAVGLLASFQLKRP